MQLKCRTKRIPPAQRAIMTDILSQAITGELVAMSNFASLVETTPDFEQKMDAAQQAYTHHNCVEGLTNLAAGYDLRPQANMSGQYWKDFRSSFLQYARKADYFACLLIQGIMQESFAVSIYDDIAAELDNGIGDFFSLLADEKREHINGTLEYLKPFWDVGPDTSTAKLEQIHWDCMTPLARLSAAKDLSGPCGLCGEVCVKESLSQINLSMDSLRGNAMKVYVVTLERLGVPTNRSLPWIAGLPV
jgi:fatty aldehyde decarbonylase